MSEANDEAICFVFFARSPRSQLFARDDIICYFSQGPKVLFRVNYIADLGK